MPLLAVLPLSDSFAEQWPLLAAESGLELRVLDDPGSFTRLADAVGIVSAGGTEARLEETMLTIQGGKVPVAAVGVLEDHRLAAAVVRAGAAGYFAIPDDYELLRQWVVAGAAALQASANAEAFSRGERGKYRFEGILGDSPALQAALERAARVIPHATVTVLLAGETGTGKELLARALHYEGPRHAAPFVDVNCSAIPDNLLESELFGHEKGAFTGASGAKPGLFELAHGGTIFLDEIGHLALPLQGKLLRVLEERAVRRVGGTRTIAVDVRVIAATHVDLAAAVKRGEFREDLYYRLNVVPVELPPLRGRSDDILLLAEHFLTRFSSEYSRPGLRLGADAVAAMRDRDWPGNIRELRNTIERAVLLSAGPVVTSRDLEPAVTAPAASSPIPFPASLQEIVLASARATLALCGGNKSAAARRLGISRPRLLRLLHGVTDEAGTEQASASPFTGTSPTEDHHA